MAEETTQKKKEEILKKLTSLIAISLSVSKEEIKPTSTLIDLGADSLDNAQTIMDIENDFDLAIPDTDMEKFTDIQSMVDYIFNHIPAPAPDSMPVSKAE